MFHICKDCPDFISNIIFFGKTVAKIKEREYYKIKHSASNIVRGLSCPLSRHKFKKRQVLFLEDDTIHHVYVILNGIIKLYKETSDGRKQIVALKKTGDIIGVESLYRGNYSATAVTLTEADICMIMADKFNEIVTKTTEATLNILKRVHKELDEARSFIQELGVKTAREKIAFFLLDYIKYVPKDKNGNIKMYLTRQEISEYIGLTQETVSRTLNFLMREKIITLNAHFIDIISPERLNKIIKLEMET